MITLSPYAPKRSDGRLAALTRMRRGILKITRTRRGILKSVRTRRGLLKIVRSRRGILKSPSGKIILWAFDLFNCVVCVNVYLHKLVRLWQPALPYHNYLLP